ncbi:MAG: lycopene cyclase family protein [Kineosporiaceae bacterium]
MTGRDVDVDVDIAIVGAGVSGLTLAWLLGESALADSSILLVDGARDEDELRTLSFWAAGPVPLEPLVRHRWSTLRIHVDEVPHDVPLHQHTYRTLFFADLQREAKSRLLGRPGNRLVDGRVDALVQDDEGVTLSIGDATFRARWVFDSRFHQNALVVDRRRYHLLRQHFHGWIVRAPTDAFEPAVATLLDFRAQTPRGTGFFYVLPFSAREALVELVTLQPVDAEQVTRAYLAQVFGLDDVELLDRESGTSPMTEQPFRWREGARVRRIGVASGRLKPSTGYAFTRIVDECALIVGSLEREGHPWAPPAGPVFWRFLDAVLLELWSSRPEEIPAVFAALFTRNPADRVLRFLDERATAGEVARLILTLPKPPFLRAALRWLARRLGRRV